MLPQPADDTGQGHLSYNEDNVHRVYATDTISFEHQWLAQCFNGAIACGRSGALQSGRHGDQAGIAIIKQGACGSV